MLEANPDLGYRDVQEIIAYSSSRGYDYKVSHVVSTNEREGNWNGGDLHWDDKTYYTGHQHYPSGRSAGTLDAWAAVRLAETWQKQSTAANEVAASGSSTVSLDIPDGRSGTSSSISIDDNFRVQMVEVTISLTHEYTGDVEISISHSGSGKSSPLLYRPGHTPEIPGGFHIVDDLHFTFTTNRFWGVESAGDWHLHVKDKVKEFTGTLNDWSISVFGDTITNDDDYIYTSEFAKSIRRSSRSCTTESSPGRRLWTMMAGTTGSTPRQPISTSSPGWMAMRSSTVAGL